MTPRGYWWGRAVGAVMFHGIWRSRVVGAERVPTGEPILFVANHTGLLDGPLVYAVAPRPTVLMVKRELFHGFLGAVLRGVGQIPVDRTTGDRAALTAALEVLRAGGAVGLFPEGTRGEGDVAQVQQGATWLALNSGARVVPVACLDTIGRGRSSLPRVRSRLTVDFGDPFALEASSARGRERLRLATEALRERLAEHVARAREAAAD
ncbi:MAG TPA: lysophospholipid acyltransferase family protein [Dermatophilaceae bacterium]|nr:lysophospholipid acyltransferase family protein [Dermatophilaceae bacterium]